MVHTIVILAVIVFLECIAALHPNVGLDEYQIMTKYGYPYEKHYVTTEDGYILEVSRVLPRAPKPLPSNSSIAFKVYPSLFANNPGEPVLLMHGIVCSGRVFVCHDADKALAFVLVNHGYDVFIGNARGSGRSRRHVTLNPDTDKEFWDFTLHEIGVFDQVAMIDYILALTNFRQVHYVGHSQGGTTFFTMAAARPEVNEKIKTAVSLGGPGIMRHLDNVFLRRLAQFEADFKQMLERLEIYEFLKYADLWRDFAKIMVDEQFGLRNIMEYILNSINVITTYNMDLDIMPVLASSNPNGASIYQLLHYMQSLNTGDFRLYDYHDPEKNYKKYGSVIPPRYNFSEISCKTVLYYSKYDSYVGEEDTLLMSNQMQNAVPKEIKVKRFSHADFLWARKINDIVFKDLLWQLKN